MTETIADRLKSIVPDRQKAESARRCRIAQKTFASYLDGTEPTASKLVQLANGLGVNLLWLATGEGPMIGDISPIPLDQDVIMLPKLDVRASAGNGSSDVSEQVVETIAFPRSLIASAVRLENIRAVTAVGDSMEPTIASGDLLLVDIAFKRVKSEAIYVLVVDGETYVKRAQKRLNGSILISSDNPRYPPEEFTDKDAEKLQVAGRVVWFGRSI